MNENCQHPDDFAVDFFARKMKEKLAIARQKGRGGWQTCTPENLSEMLREHVEKGDPIDVANFCMFLFNLGQSITPKELSNPSNEVIVKTVPPEPVPLSDERIDHIADLVIKSMPDGIRGFMKVWGYQQFARQLLEVCAGYYREPKQDNL